MSNRDKHGIGPRGWYRRHRQDIDNFLVTYPRLMWLKKWLQAIFENEENLQDQITALGNAVIEGIDTPSINMTVTDKPMEGTIEFDSLSEQEKFEYIKENPKIQADLNISKETETITIENPPDNKIDFEVENELEIKEDGAFSPDYKTIVEYLIDEINGIKNKPLIPFNLNRQKKYKSTDLFSPDGTEFVQGISINEDKNEFYVMRQVNGAKKITIYRYALDTEELIDSKYYETSGGPYGEGPCYFYNSYNELCFIVRIQYEKGAAIFNYSTGVLGEKFEMNGSFKMAIDNNRQYLLTNFGDASRTHGVYIYDLQSVIDRSPELLKTIYFNLSVMQGNKVQGLTMIDSIIYLACGGGNYKYPSVKAISMGGEVLTSYDLDKISLREQVDESTSDFQYESEGVTFASYNGFTFPVFTHVMRDTGKIWMYLAGDSSFPEIKQRTLSTETTNGPFWHDLPLAEGVTAYGDDVIPQYMLDNMGFVHLRGVCTHEYKGTTPNLILGTTPYLFVPENNSFYVTIASLNEENPAAANRIQTKYNGDIILLATSANPNPDIKQFTCLDGIVFPARKGV